MDLRGFLWAIVADWVTLMSGIASVVLSILGIVRKWDRVRPWIFWLAAASCFFFAAGRVWTTEHRAKIQAEQQLHDLTVPGLFGSVRQYSDGKMTINGTRQFLIFLVVSVGNKGADSIAEGFELVLSTKNGKTISAAPTFVPNDLTMHFSGQAIIAKESSDIFNLTSKPVKRGDLITGRLFFVINDPDLVLGEDQSSVVKVRFVDYLSNPYESSPMVLTESNKESILRYFPGAGFEVPNKRSSK